MDTEIYDITDAEILAEEDMPESTPQFDQNQHALAVLEWQYKLENWFIGGNLAVVYARRKYIAPDLALFKGVVLSPEERKRQKSYRIKLPDRPPPNVVFEFSSADNWEQDLIDKVQKYQEMSAKEYFAFDPNVPMVWRPKAGRLKGWHYTSGTIQQIQPDQRGWLWSAELDSWLGAEDETLQFYDAAGNRRLTAAEAGWLAEEQERAAKEAAWVAREKERADKEAAWVAREKERADKEAAWVATRKERADKERERAAKEAAWAKLRELNIDPESL